MWSKIIKSCLFLQTISFILLITACNSPTAKFEKINRAEHFQFDYNQLVGEWEQINENNKFVEKWNWKNDSVLEGVSFEIIENDTIDDDTLQVDQLKIIDPKFQSKFGVAIRNRFMDSFVWFDEKGSNKEKIIFENQTQGYPDKITYFLPSNNRITVKIEGDINDTLTIKEFDYRRRVIE